MRFLVLVNSRLEARYVSKVTDRTAERDIQWVSRKEHGMQRTIGLVKINLIISQTEILRHASKDQASQLNDNDTKPRFTACFLRILKSSTSS